MKKTYSFCVVSGISMHFETEADSLEEAIAAAKSAGTQRLCHHCAEGEEGCWNTSGEIDEVPQDCDLVEVIVDNEVDNRALRKARKAWS